MEPSSTTQNGSATLSGIILVFSGNFKRFAAEVETLPTPIILPLIVSMLGNSIDSWSKCKDAFIGKYYPPAMIISLRSSFMNFKQSDNEHVSQAWERMKSLVKDCPTHGLTAWMIIQTFMQD